MVTRKESCAEKMLRGSKLATELTQKAAKIQWKNDVKPTHLISDIFSFQTDCETNMMAINTLEDASYRLWVESVSVLLSN